MTKALVMISKAAFCHPVALSILAFAPSTKSPNFPLIFSKMAPIRTNSPANLKRSCPSDLPNGPAHSETRLSFFSSSGTSSWNSPKVFSTSISCLRPSASFFKNSEADPAVFAVPAQAARSSSHLHHSAFHVPSRSAGESQVLRLDENGAGRRSAGLRFLPQFVRPLAWPGREPLDEGLDLFGLLLEIRFVSWRPRLRIPQKQVAQYSRLFRVGNNPHPLVCFPIEKGFLGIAGGGLTLSFGQIDFNWDLDGFAGAAEFHGRTGWDARNLVLGILARLDCEVMEATGVGIHLEHPGGKREGKLLLVLRLQLADFERRRETGFIVEHVRPAAFDFRRIPRGLAEDLAFATRADVDVLARGIANCLGTPGFDGHRPDPRNNIRVAVVEVGEAAFIEVIEVEAGGSFRIWTEGARNMNFAQQARVFRD